uniref:Uncharacterized protein n=1 Tax=Glossina pallidipes TaxID=7398 RepID=A0A1A9ZDV1_GLOPL
MFGKIHGARLYGINIFCVLLFPLLYCKAVRRQVIITNDYQDVFQDTIIQIQDLKRSTGAQSWMKSYLIRQDILTVCLRLRIVQNSLKVIPSIVIVCSATSESIQHS